MDLNVTHRLFGPRRARMYDVKTYAAAPSTPSITTRTTTAAVAASPTTSPALSSPRRLLTLTTSSRSPTRNTSLAASKSRPLSPSSSCVFSSTSASANRPLPTVQTLLGLLFALNAYHVLASATAQELLAALRSILPKSVKCMVSSPVYNLLGLRTSAGYPNQPRAMQYDNCTDNMPEEEYQEWLVAVLNELYRILRDDGILFWNHRDRHINRKSKSPLHAIWQSKFREPHQTLVLQHPTVGNHSCTMFGETHEYVYVLMKDPKCACAVVNALDIRMSGSVWRTRSSQSIGKSIDHPCPMDKSVVKALILSATDPGDVVMDPFAGSGTTLLVAERLGRQFMGFDISNKYYAVWQKRADKLRARKIR